jgi:CubicO group peptidase (beta-lactamase class C family)
MTRQSPRHACPFVGIALAMCMMPADAKSLERAALEQTGLSAAALGRMKASMTALVDTGKRAGIVYAVAHKNKIIAQEAIGRRDLEKNLPMEVDTIFRLASLTRVLTGAAILTLVDDGRLEMDDPVSKYIPEFANTQVVKEIAGDKVITEPQKRPMTVHHLFTYTAGFGSAPNWPARIVPKQGEILNPDVSLAEGMHRLASYPLLTHPGDKWRYGIPGDVLGRVAEVASGLPLDEFLRQRMYEPLGLKDTGFWTREPYRLAAVYTTDSAGKLVPTDVDRLSTFTRPSLQMGASGGLAGTVPDYLRFAQMLVNGGTLDGVRVLKAETVKAMLSRQTTPDQGMTYWYDPDRYESTKGYAWGFAIGVRVDGVPQQMPGVSSDAGWAGFTNTWFFVDPRNQVAAVAMSQLVGADKGAPVLTALRTGVYEALGIQDAFDLNK